MKKGSTRKEELQITSVSYIHDPAATSKWMELYVGLLKKRMLDDLNKREE